MLSIRQRDFEIKYAASMGFEVGLYLEVRYFAGFTGLIKVRLSPQSANIDPVSL